MRKAVFASLWFMCFTYSILLLIYGNSGIIEYNKALKAYEDMEKNIQILSIYALENESMLNFWKNTLANNFVHELGYTNDNEVIVFPIINHSPSVKKIEIEQFTSASTNNMQFIEKALIGGCIMFVLMLLINFFSRKRH